MKLLKLMSAAAPVLALSCLTGVVAPASRADVSFDFFYSDLSPHGRWLVAGQYGHVWQPAVYRHGWNPYNDGHWEYTDCGWTWVSDYNWGDVPYHYGTWVDDPGYGWVWVPGYTWAPAWVTFRTGPDYIGWAPVAPGFSVGFSSGGASFGASVGASSFVFVPTRYFAAPRLRNYYVPESRRTTIINHTTIVNNLTVQNNIVINRGPDLQTVERATGRRFTPQPIERVRHAAPFTTVRREELAVSPQRDGGRVRAAEPVSAQQKLPPPMSAPERRAYRGNPQVRQERARAAERTRAPMASLPEARLQQERLQGRNEDILQRREQQQQRQRTEARVNQERPAPRATPQPREDRPKQQQQQRARRQPKEKPPKDGDK